MLRQTSKIQPKFNLLHDYLIQTQHYKFPHNMRNYAKQEMEELLDANIIEKSTSSYASPVVYVKKKLTSKTQNPSKIKFCMATDCHLLN